MQNMIAGLIWSIPIQSSSYIIVLLVISACSGGGSKISPPPEIPEVNAPAEIDELNIYQASREAMRRAVAGLDIKPDYLLVDARSVPGIRVEQLAIKSGDAKSQSIAAASILAKVHRDDLMQEYAKEYPGYGFENHAGYPTKVHVEALKRLGPTPIHRQSFGPVRDCLL